MALSQKKRQRKLEQKKAKRKSKRAALAKQKQAGLVERLAAAPDAPIRHCLLGGDLSQGMVSILISRELPNGDIAFAQFLLDTFCLGIKDSFARVASSAVYGDRYEDFIFDADKIAPEDARKLVEEAAEYGRGNGFPPRGEYQKALALFRGFRVEDSSREFEFGKDGKPFYINGPHDTLADMTRIHNTLEHHCGPDGFDSMAVLSESGFLE